MAAAGEGDAVDGGVDHVSAIASGGVESGEVVPLDVAHPAQFERAGFRQGEGRRARTDKS